jgi:hypothetical protein
MRFTLYASGRRSRGEPRKKRKHTNYAPFKEVDDAVLSAGRAIGQ